VGPQMRTLDDLIEKICELFDCDLSEEDERFIDEKYDLYLLRCCEDNGEFTKKEAAKIERIPTPAGLR